MRMAIYADKKNGKLTGRFRVELTKGTERFRKRYDSFQEAEQAERDALAAWAVGETPKAPTGPAANDRPTIASVMELAKGKLWDGDVVEDIAWSHIRIIGENVGLAKALDDITTHTVDDIVSKLRKLGKSDATINRYLSHLRTFLKWSKGRGYRTVPVEEVQFSWRKESPGRIRWITEAEEAKLEELLPQDIWWIVKIAIETGCRREEILSVELDQINGNRLHLWKTKTDSPRTVPMGPRTTDMLTELVKGKRMPTWEALRYHWRKAREKMELTEDKEFVFHCTRHTRATRLLDKGVNVLVIKEWLGHKRIETTQRYTHVKPANLDAALAMVGGF